MFWRHEAIFQVLLAHGIDTDSEETRGGALPLDRAAITAHAGIAKFLLEHSANSTLPRTINWSPYTGIMDDTSLPLVTAIYRGHTTMVELLLANRADPTWESSTINQWERSEVIRRRPRFRAEDNLWMNLQKQTALFYAIKEDHEEIVRILLQAGGDAKDRNLPPMIAVKAESLNLDIMRLLLDNGADLEAEDRDGFTVLSWAWTTKFEAVKLLLEKGASPTAFVGYMPDPRQGSVEVGSRFGFRKRIVLGVRVGL